MLIKLSQSKKAKQIYFFNILFPSKKNVKFEKNKKMKKKLY